MNKYQEALDIITKDMCQDCDIGKQGFSCFNVCEKYKSKIILRELIDDYQFYQEEYELLLKEKMPKMLERVVIKR